MRTKNQLAKALLQRKTYSIYGSKKKYDVLASKREGDYVVLLCRDGWDEDYVVFTDLLMPKSIPSDHFYGSIKSAVSAYVDTVIERLEE